MLIDDLEELLNDTLGAEFGATNFRIETNKNGEIVIFTGLRTDDDGDIVSIDEDEDPDADPDFEPFEDDESDD